MWALAGLATAPDADVDRLNRQRASMTVIESAKRPATTRAASAGFLRFPSGQTSFSTPSVASSSLTTADVEGAQPQPRRHLSTWRRTETAALQAVDQPRHLHVAHTRIPEEHDRTAPLVDGKTKAATLPKGNRHTNPLEPTYILPRPRHNPETPPPQAQGGEVTRTGKRVFNRPGSAPIVVLNAARNGTTETVADRLVSAGVPSPVEAAADCAGSSVIVSSLPKGEEVRATRNMRTDGEFKRAAQVGKLLVDPTDAAIAEAARQQQFATKLPIDQRVKELVTSRRSETSVLEHCVGSMQALVSGDGQRDSKVWRDVSQAERSKLLSDLKVQQAEYFARRKAADAERRGNAARGAQDSVMSRERPHLELVTTDITGTKSFADVQRALDEPGSDNRRHTNPLEPTYPTLDGNGATVGRFEQGVRSGMRSWLSNRTSSANNTAADIDGAAPHLRKPMSQRELVQHIAKGRRDEAEQLRRFSINNILLAGQSPPVDGQGAPAMAAASRPRASGKRHVTDVAAARNHGSPIDHHAADAGEPPIRMPLLAATASVISLASSTAAPQQERYPDVFKPYDAAQGASESFSANASEAQAHYVQHPSAVLKANLALASAIKKQASSGGGATAAAVAVALPINQDDTIVSAERIGRHPQLTFAAAASRDGRNTNPVVPDYRLEGYHRNVRVGAATEATPAAAQSSRQGTAQQVAALRTSSERALQASPAFGNTIAAARNARSAQSLREEIAAVRELPNYK